MCKERNKGDEIGWLRDTWGHARHSRRWGHARHTGWWRHAFTYDNKDREVRDPN